MPLFYPLSRFLTQRWHCQLLKHIKKISETWRIILQPCLYGFSAFDKYTLPYFDFLWKRHKNPFSRPQTNTPTLIMVSSNKRLSFVFIHQERPFLIGCYLSPFILLERACTQSHSAEQLLPRITWYFFSLRALILVIDNRRKTNMEEFDFMISLPTNQMLGIVLFIWILHEDVSIM